MSIRRVLGALGIVGAMVVGAGGAVLASAGTASAPEPAQLTADLVGAYSTATAVLTTGDPTSVLEYPDYWVYDPSQTVGVPCSTGDLRNGDRTYQVIAGHGDYRICQDPTYAG